MPSKFLSMSRIYLCAHRLDVGSEKSRNVHMDELRKSASIVQGVFEKQLQVLGKIPNSTKDVIISKGLGVLSRCQNKG